jgi:beta-N-acetylhexosaminidase
VVRRSGLTLPALWVALAVAAAACSHHSGQPVGSNHITSVPTEPGSSGAPLATTSTVPEAACTSVSSVRGWPLARRAAQLIVIPALNGDLTPLATSIATGVGGVILLGVAPGPGLATEIKIANSRAASPLLVMADEEGGGIQRLAALVGSLPWPRQMAASMTTAQVEAAVGAVATRMRNLGVDVDLAPVADVDGGSGPSATDPDGLRSFSADPATAARYSAAFVRGLRDGGVLAVVKHFPGLGGSSGNTDYGPAATRPISVLRTTQLPVFTAAFTAGAAGVMVANASVPGLTSEPASLSAAAIQQLLRGQLGFSGFVVTDSLSAGAMSASHDPVPAAAVAAIEAGADLVLFGSTLTSVDVAELSPTNVLATTSAIINGIDTAVQKDELPAAALDAAVVKVLAAKGRLCPS